jgi:hypothetical protein
MYNLLSANNKEHIVIDFTIGLPCLLALFGIVLWTLSRRTLPRLLSNESHRPTRKGEQSQRHSAKWPPSAFELPNINPILEPLEYIRPLPYRPFRGGPQQ